MVFVAVWFFVLDLGVPGHPCMCRQFTLGQPNPFTFLSEPFSELLQIKWKKKNLLHVKNY